MNWKKVKEGILFIINVPVNTKAKFIYNEINKELEPGKYEFVI